MNIKLFFDEKFFLGSGKRKIWFLLELVLGVGLAMFAFDKWGAPAWLGWVIGAGRSLREILLGMLGALEFSGTLSWAEFARAVFMRFFSVVVFGGILVSTLCSMMQQREDKVRAGLVRYRGLRKHYIVVGWSPLVASLVEKLLDGDMDAWHPGGDGMRSWAERHLQWRMPRLLLFTASDVANVRRDLEGRLSPSLYKRIIFYHGTIDLAIDNGARKGGGCGWWKIWMLFRKQQNPFDALFRDMGAAAARQIYLLADNADEQGRDAKLLAFAQGLCDRLQTFRAAHYRWCFDLPQVVPVYAELDARGSQDYAKRLDFVTIRQSRKLPRNVRLLRLRICSPFNPSSRKYARKTVNCIYRHVGFYAKTIPYFRPFSFHELWARRLFAVDAPEEYRLDYRPMGENDYVHLVLVGFNRMGSALTLEAMRSCHYVNFDPDDKEMRTCTRITVIDLNPQEIAFRARYPHLDQIRDVKIEFIMADVASDEVREMLKNEALEPHCLLTIAVCPEDSDTALSIALGLPEEVFRRQEIGASDRNKHEVPQRAAWKNGGNHVLVRQNLVSGAARALSLAKIGPYACVHAFGMIPDVLTHDSFEERSAMYHNMIYDQPVTDKVAWIADVCRSRRNLADTIPTAFEKYVGLDRKLVWSNVYVEDCYGAILHALELEVSTRDDTAGTPLRDAKLKKRLDANMMYFPFDASALTAILKALKIDPNRLQSVEHRRWMAERTLMGYRCPTEDERQTYGEKLRDDDFQIHPSIKSFMRLPSPEIAKDDNNIRAIPIILALEGFTIKPMGEQ